MRKMIALGIFIALALISCRAAAGIQMEVGPTAVPVEILLTPEPVNCDDEDCLDVCLWRISNVIPEQSFDPIGGDYVGTDANINLVVYDVTDGELGNPQILYVPDTYEVYQQDFDAHKRILDYAFALLPPDQFKWVSRYQIFTDGPSNTTAWVDHPDFDRAHWTLAVDVLDSSSPVYLTYTLVHEYAHLMTLNTDQVPDDEFYGSWYQNPRSCEQMNIPEGCSTPESYINQYYQRFWKAYFDEWMEVVEKPIPDTDEEFRALVHTFYENHPEQFISEYAATNILEDMAETFTSFVLEPKPTGDTPVDQKILFYYEFPELVEMRRNTIQNVCSYVK